MKHVNGAVVELVEQFKDRITKNREEQAREALTQIQLAPRREITDAPPFQVVAFWCNCCSRDYTTLGRIIVEGQGQTASAVYVSKCPEGHENYRYVTDTSHDPYYTRSRAVQADREAHELDMISPHDDRFRTVYREQWLAHESKREALALAGASRET